MAGGAIRWLARLVLTGLLVASLVLAGVNLSALARSPAGSAFVERSTAGIAAATERALISGATSEVVAARLEALLQQEPRNWLAIDAIEALATERAIPLSAELLALHADALAADSGLWKGAGDCLECIRDATTCEMALILLCRAPIDLSPIGDLAGVTRGAVNYMLSRDVDEVDLILSFIGLSAVALTMASGGSSLTVKAGAGFAKMARSMNRWPGALTKPLIRAYREGVDWSRVPSVRTPDALMSAIRPEVMRPAVMIFEDVGTMGKTTVLDALHLMKYVDDPADLSRMARASDALGPRMVGTIEVLGKSRLLRLTLRVADEVWLVATGLLGALAALLGLLQSVLSNAVLRVIRRLAQAPDRR